jgi:hypothetical protein
MMGVALASAWNPRGELPRFKRCMAQLEQTYLGMAISLPPQVPPEITRELAEIGQGNPNRLVYKVTADWSWGRHVALQEALGFSAEHIHYVDFDRLLRWIETRPEEWRMAIQEVQRWDCLVIGRTVQAYTSHPRALVETEAISNAIVSHLLGRPVDVSAGSKGFQRRAAQYLVENCQPGRALGTDGEWPVRLQRAGFTVGYLEADGLDWEIADREQPEAASAERQRQMAEAYDADPENWKSRVAVALEIVQSALEAGDGA